MIIVTGASRGIGRSICDRLIGNRKEILGIARNVENLPFPSRACDVSSYEDLKNIVKSIKSTGVEVSGLINAAGVAAMNLALTTPPEVVERLIRVNLLGTIYCSQLIAPMMIRKRRGTIINFSTIAVSLGLKGESVYAASKAGVEGFSRAFAREMSIFNINVNCIAPGPIKTSLLNGVTDMQINNIISQQIITKQFTTNDICDVVEILLDERTRSLTGEVFKIGGA